MNSAAERFKELLRKGEILFKDDTKQSEALEHFKDMIVQYPENAYFKIRLAELLINIRKWEEASLLTQEIINNNNPKFFAFQFHATVLIKRGYLHEAEELLNKAAQLFPEKKKLTTQLFLLTNMKKEISILRQIIK